MEKKGLEADHNSPVTIELMDAAAIADAIRDASRHFAHLEKKQRLYVIGLATRGVPLAVRLTEELKKAGINAAWYVSEGTAHEFQTWRRSLYQLAPLLFRD